MTEAQRLLARLHRRLQVDPATGCWIWRGATRPPGYGVVRLRGKVVKAHRLTYSLVSHVPLDDLPPLIRQCASNGCVNPHHWAPGSPRPPTTAKISPRLAGEIGEAVAGGLSIRQAAALFGVSHTTIRRVVAREGVVCSNTPSGRGVG